MLEARNHLRDIGTGDTRPQVFSCQNGITLERWVLKLMNGAVAELAADWIGSLLPHRLGIPCPAVNIVRVPAEALLTAPPDVRNRAKPGPAFASREMVSTKAIDSERELVDIARRDSGAAADLGSLYALDTWIEVLDRQKPDGSWNLLRDNESGGLYVIDFGKGLTSCIHVMLGGEPSSITPPYPESIRLVADGRAARATCNVIETISESELNAIVSSVPSLWLGEQARTRIVKFLISRTSDVRNVCQRMHLGGPPWT